MLEHRVGVAGKVVALAFFLADIHQPDGRVGHAENVLGVDAAHDAVLEQVLRLGADVGPDVEQHARAMLGRQHGGDAGPLNVLEEALEKVPAGHHGARYCQR